MPRYVEAIAILVSLLSLSANCQGHNQSIKTISFNLDGTQNISQRTIVIEDFRDKTTATYTWKAGNSTWKIFSPGSMVSINKWINYSTIIDGRIQIELQPERTPNFIIDEAGEFVGGTLEKGGLYRMDDGQYHVGSYKPNDPSVIVKSVRRAAGSVLFAARDNTGKEWPTIIQKVKGLGFLTVTPNHCLFINQSQIFHYYRKDQAIKLRNVSNVERITVYLQNKTVVESGHKKETDHGVWTSQDNQTTVKFGPEDGSVKVAGRWNLELIGNELQSPLGVTKWTPSHGSYRIESRSDDLNISAVSDWRTASVTINDFTYTVNNTDQIWSFGDRTVIRTIE